VVPLERGALDLRAVDREATTPGQKHSSRMVTEHTNEFTWHIVQNTTP